MNLEWSRPLGLFALALPLIVWWLARRSLGAPLEATGTLEVWREIAREHAPRGPGRRAELALWLALTALVCGALALAGPRAAREREPITWRVVVDRSPSMYLAHDGADGPTRIAVALSRARELVAGARASADSLEWIASDGESVVGAAPPEGWSRTPKTPLPELVWTSLDAPGTLVVTDRNPEPEPRHAGFVASGGAVAHGPIAFDVGQLVTWNGAALETVESSTRQRARIDARLGGTALERVALAWAKARRVELVSDGACELELVAAENGGEVDVTTGRDGWTLRGPAVACAPAGGSESWLTARVVANGERIDVVRWRIGHVAVGLRALDEPLGDPAAFAVSWTVLFDAALAPPPPVVALAERVDAGAASGRAPVRSAGASEADTRITTAFAACATLLALVALALRA